MDERLTLYQKTVRRLPGFITQLKKSFDDLGIHTINLGSDRKKNIELITVEYASWLKLTINSTDIIDNYLFNKYKPLEDWIPQWLSREMSNSGQNKDLIQVFDMLVDDIKIGILTVILYYRTNGPPDFYQFENLAKNVFNAYKKLNFDSVVMNGKKDQFKSSNWPPGQSSISWQMFIDEINKNLDLFIRESINQIYLAEIKANLSIKNEKVTFGSLEDIFSYFWGSLRNFRRFINRNYLYGMIEKGLMGDGVNYSSLLTNYNGGLPILKIRVSFCPLPHFTGKEFEIGPRGMKNSKRNVQDQIVTFGKDSNEEFTNDISIPNMQSLDNIFAFIFVNYKGYSLIDIAPRGSVKIKLNPGEEIKLEKDMVVIFGYNHAFVIDFDENNPIPHHGKQAFLLKVKGNEDCKTTNKFRDIGPDSFNKKITIGRLENNTVELVHDDISGNHAECYYKLEDNSWYLKDLESQNGTFYKLKKKSQICEANRNISNIWYDANEGTPSEAYLLRDRSTFVVENFTFFCSLI